MFTQAGIKWEYEATAIPWLPPRRKYHPDFKITNTSGKVWYLELKGRFTSADRAKMLAVKTQHPDKDIRLMFQNPHIKLSKVSKTTYAQWATAKGFLWCSECIPEEWLAE